MESTNFRDRIRYELNDIEREDIFRRFVDSQRKQFEAYLNFVNDELIVLKHYRIVSDFTRLLARIKSVESSINNDNKDNKALNDIFGMEIDSGTPGESNFTVMLLKGTLTQTKDSPKKKKNGYRAHHYSGYPKDGNVVEKLEEILNTTYDSKSMFEEYMNQLPIRNKEELTEEEIQNIKEYYDDFCRDLNAFIKDTKKRMPKAELNELKKDLKNVEQKYHEQEKLQNEENEYQPIIEIQCKTTQVAILANIGTASHGDYKGENMKKIQEEYNRTGGFPLSRLPIMYESRLEGGIDNPIPPRILSSTETARTMYPGLITKKEGRGVNK